MVLLLASGCASMTPLMNRNEIADRIAQAGGFKKSYIKTKEFTLIALFAEIFNITIFNSHLAPVAYFLLTHNGQAGIVNKAKSYGLSNERNIQ